MPELLEEALAAAGGRERWERAERIRARVRTGGLLPRTRVPGNRFADCEVTVSTARQRAVLEPYPEPGRRGVLEAGRVRIERDDRSVAESRADPRARFFGLSGLRRNLRWDALDSTYFAAYALWNYLLMPLLLTRPGVEVGEDEPWSGEGGRWRRLVARFPAEIETHSREQTFFFDEDGRQVRHDYTAEVVGGWAKAAHYCAGHRSFDGLLFPTLRRVLPRRRNLHSLPHPTLVRVELDHVSVESS